MRGSPELGDFVEVTKAVLSDGSIVDVDLYRAVVIFDGRQREVLVYSTEGYSLIGMSMLSGHKLSVEVVDGGSVTIRSSR